MVSGEAWVLKKFQIDPSGSSGAYLYIEARQPGFTAFMLNIMGLDPNASVKVTRGAISMRQSSLMGMDQVTTALSSVGAFIGGYRKPISYLFMATVFLIGGFIGEAMADFGGISAIIGIVLALTMFLLYVFNKQMYIGFETSGGTVHVLIFKKAIIEGVPVDIGLIEDAILMVNGLISSSGVGGGAVMESHVIRAAPQMVSVPITTGPDDTPSEDADEPEETPEEEPSSDYDKPEETPSEDTDAPEEFIGGDNLRVNLYNKLAKELGATDVTFEQFDEAMNSPERRINFYNLAQSHNINLGSFEQFEQKMINSQSRNMDSTAPF